MIFRILVGVFLLAKVITACSLNSETGNGNAPFLRLATTTSTYDSGLLDAILPEFERQYQVEVAVIVVGTGQALALGERGDVDVVLVHAPSVEEAFVEAGHGVARSPVMFNDFILVGPHLDPAQIATAPDVTSALSMIANGKFPFASRGDQSGTHIRERMLWEATAFSPSPSVSWYYSLGQGMGETLKLADEKDAYTITDRGTFLAFQKNLPHLSILFGGDSPAENIDIALRNFYSVILINPAKHPSVKAALAEAFLDWLTSIPTQENIAYFGQQDLVQPLFYPNSEQWRASNQ